MKEKEEIYVFLVRINAINQDQVDEVLLKQKSGDNRLFGEIANDLGYIDKKAIRKYFHLI